jgi:hypothetical protein
MARRVAVTLVCLLAFAAVVTVFCPLKARAQTPHDAGHAQHHDVYKTWMQPGGFASCCDAKKTVDGVTTGDCYPTQARLVQGHWVALRDDGVWVDIPDDKIIRERNPGSEDAHLCFNYGQVLCFVPPDTGG